MEEKKRPIHEIRMGGVKAAIWKNEGSSGTEFLTANFHTLYRDRDGKWCRSSSFGRDDLLLLAKVANEVHSYMVLQSSAASTEAPQDQGQNEESVDF